MNPSNQKSFVGASRGIASATIILAGIGLSASNAADVTYQYFRYTATQLRNNGAANSIQLSEFQFIDNGVPINTAGVTVTNPGGDTPGNEGPEKIIDGNTGTKWLDFTKFSPLVFQFPAPVTIDEYNFATANDSDERDPVSWTFEGSTDGLAWTIIDEKFTFATTTARLTYQGGFSIGAPTVVSFTRSRSIVLNGQPTQLTWNTLGADPGGVSIAPGVGVVAASDSVGVIPPSSADTDFTLTATNSGGSDTATVTVRAVTGGTVNYRYVRFTPTKLRSGGLGDIQLSEFTLLDGITALTAVDATNPGGANGFGEGPLQAIDNDFTTKWFDGNSKPLIVDLGVPTDIDGYSFGTGNDAPERDPLRWLLEGSNDGTAWTLIDNVTAFDFNMPTDRQVASEDIPLPGAAVDPFVNQFVGDAPKLILGQPLVLTWDVAGATGVTIDNGIGSVASSGSVTVNPVANTTYTLTATGTGPGPASATFSTEIINPAITTINYANFDAAGDELGLLGNASVLNDSANIPLPGNFERLRLTPDGFGQGGTAWFRKRIDFSAGFQSFFDLQFNTFGDTEGADGLAFIIQNNVTGTGSEPDGSNEDGLPTAALNIKFDSYDNDGGGAGEPSSAFVQVRSGTTVLATSNLLDFPALLPFPGTDPNDLTTNGGTAAPYQVRVDYIPGDLDVYFNGVLVVDSLNVNLVTSGAVNAAGKGYVGFSARTGGFIESHDVTRWLLTEGPPPAAAAPLVIKNYSFNFGTDQLTLTWGSTDTKTYKVTTSSNLLAPWVPVATGIPGAPAQNETSTTVGFTQGLKAFFRVEEE